MFRRLPALASLVLLLVFLLFGVPHVVWAGSADVSAPAETFNVIRLGSYPNDFDGVFAAGSQAFLNDSLYDWEYPPSSYGYAHLFNIADPQNPVFVTKLGDTSQTIGDMYAEGGVLALAISGKSLYSSLGELAVYGLSGGSKICHTYFDYNQYGMAYSVVVRDNYAFVGVAKGLAVVDFSHPNPPGQCPPATLSPTSSVYEIVQVGTLLYLAQPTGVRVVNAGNPISPSEVGFYPTPKTVYDVAVSPANYIYAGTDYGLDVIDGASGQVVTHYGPNSTVAVAADGAKLYLGTRDDLQVLNMEDPAHPQLIGRYADANMEFERGLSFDGGLVHSVKGIFQYRPEPPALLLEAQGAGVTVNGQPLASGSSVVVKGNERIVVPTSIGKVYFSVRCNAGAPPKWKVELGCSVVQWCKRKPQTAVQVVDDILTLSEIASVECPVVPPRLATLADPPALPLILEDGPVDVSVMTTVAAVALNTAHGEARAPAGSRMLADHDPALQFSQFACLTGTVLVQPAAPGAPALTLHPAQRVIVTPTGASPILRFSFTFLPLIRR